MSKDKVIDITSLPRPAAGVGGVPLPVSAMAKPEKLETVKSATGPEAPRVEGTYEDIDSEIVPAKPYKPARTSAKLQEHQKHNIAQAIVGGLPVAEIAGMVRHTPKYIKQCIAEDPVISDLVDHYSSISMRAMVAYKFDILERYNQAMAVLDDALIDKDIRVRFMAMEKVFKSHETDSKNASTPVVEMNFTDPEAHRALTEATMGIHDLLAKITSGEMGDVDVEKHLHNTLPGPEDVKGHVQKRG